jgi:hypothetical protein
MINDNKSKMKNYLVAGAGIVMLLAAATTVTTAYAQGAAFYKKGQLNEEQQGLISQVLNRLLNKTSEPRMSIFDDGNMIITWTDKITTTAPDGRVFEVEEDTSLSAPHNFTTANGYAYRDGVIYKPDGTELFASSSSSSSSFAFPSLSNNSTTNTTLLN